MNNKTKLRLVIGIYALHWKTVDVSLRHSQRNDLRPSRPVCLFSLHKRAVVDDSSG